MKNKNQAWFVFSTGQVMPEYLIVMALFSIALLLGPNSPIEALFNAFADYYARFTYASSRP
jgi:hypothetical protein